MASLHNVGAFDDSIAALMRVRSSVRDAGSQLDDLPRVVGRGSVVADVRRELDASAETLTTFADSAAAVAPDLGGSFRQFALSLRDASAHADTRAGAGLLRARLKQLHADVTSSMHTVRAARSDALYPTAEAATARLRELAIAGPADMTRQRWIELADIAALTGERRASLMSDRIDAHAEWASRLVDLGFDPMDNPQLVASFNAWRAPIALPDRATATERVANLASVPATQLSRADLFDLHAISTLEEGIRPESFNAFALEDALEAAMTGDGLTARSVTAARLRGIESTRIWPSREHASRAALDLIGAGPSEMTAERMEVLASIAELPRTHNPGITKFAKLRDLASGLQSAGSLAKLEAMTTGRSGRASTALHTTNDDQRIIRRWLNQMRGPVHWPTRDAATSRLQDIAFAWRDRGALSAIEFDDLDALARLDDTLRPRHLEPFATGLEPPRYADASSFMVATFDDRTIDDWVRGADA